MLLKHCIVSIHILIATILLRIKLNSRCKAKVVAHKSSDHSWGLHLELYEPVVMAMYKTPIVQLRNKQLQKCALYESVLAFLAQLISMNALAHCCHHIVAFNGL